MHQVSHYLGDRCEGELYVLGYKPAGKPIDVTQEFTPEPRGLSYTDLYSCLDVIAP